MEAITDPLKVVRGLYAARSPADGDDYGVKARFSALLADPDLAAKVPILTEETAELLPNQCLVRFRGLVQDMLNPEYYVGEFQRPDGTWQTAKYADRVDEPVPDSSLAGGAGTRIAERRPLLLVPVPGESEWAAGPRAAAARASAAALAAGSGGHAGAALAAAKRPREDAAAATAGAGNEGEDAMSVSMLVSEATGLTTADDGDSAASRARRPAGAGTAQPGQQQEASSSGGSGAGEELPPGCCMAYLYDDAEVKLNDVVEVVGVVSRVPELAAAHMAAAAAGGQGAGSMLLDEVLASHLPTSRAPRLHAILLTTESEAAAGTTAGAAAVPQQQAAPPGEARARLLGFLSQVLGGDDVAAEYLLLQLVGRVHHRTQESSVGLLSLNLVAEPSSAAAAASVATPAAPDGALPTSSGAAGQQRQQQQQQLSQLGAALAAALGALAPRVVALPLSVEGLNRRPWWPRRDQSSQRLVGGPLQLAAGTQVLLDETVMAAGTLSEVGLRNLAALQHLMVHQRVAYDFEYFALEQPSDAPVTVLSLGRSLLRDAVGVSLPLRPTAPLADAAGVAAAAASADLAPLRAYLAAARAADFSIPPDMEAFLQRELAAARQKDREVTERTFHTWMNLARLLALSRGEGALTRECWAAMRALEQRRQQRLAQQARA